MKRFFIIALIAFATVVAYGCKKDETEVPGSDTVVNQDKVR